MRIQMKGILKIYHPEETLKYHIRSTYCKAVYYNDEYFLNLEIITDESLDHVEDDSLQYNFPQIGLFLNDFPLEKEELRGQKISLSEEEAESYTEVELYDDELANLLENELSFSDAEELNLSWTGKIKDFFCGNAEPVPFKLKCHFKAEEPQDTED